MQKLRKALVISVMSFTVLSMCVVTAPKVEAAAVAGDLIKMNGLSSVYYLAADGKRYVFPNEPTYFSWYSDFSGVVTIPQAELESYPLGRNVTVRPGTKLVKITTNPNVYAVTPGGVLVKVPSEATATTLWGASWAKRVIDVPDAFFTNYTIGSTEVSATAYPAGSLVKYAASPDVFYIAADGKAQKITSESAFLANRFKWSDIVTTTLTAPIAGADITGAVSTLTDTSSGAGGTIGAGTGLTIALSSDTPGSASVPSKATLVPFVTVNLTASNDGAVTVNDLVFTRFGTGATTDFNGGYLFDGVNRLSTKRSVNSSDNTISFNALGLVVEAGKTRTVTLRMDGKIAGNASGNHGFKLTSASDIKTNGASVSGSFPVAGNIMTYSNAATAATVVLTTGGGSGNRKVGETNVILGTFDIANDGQEIVKINHIKLKQNGDAGNGAVNNLSLDLDGTVVASGVSMVDKYVDFVLATPFEVKKSTTITATIRGDVITDINKTIQLYLNQNVDFDAKGTAYGDFYSALVTNTSLDNETAVTAGQAEIYTIKGSEINVSFDGPQAADVKNDTTNVVFANFKILSQQDVNIETLTLTSSITGQGSEVLENVEMVDTVNGLSFSTDAETATGTQTSAFENIYLKAGVQYTFAIQGDIPDTVSAGAIYQFSIDFSSGFTARFQDTNETLVAYATDLSATSLTGKNMTVAAPSVTMARVTGNNANAVKGATGVLLYKMKISASDVDSLKVTKLTFDSNIGQPATHNFSEDWSRLYLYVEDGNGEFGTKLDDESSLGIQIVPFTGFTLDIPKGLSNGVYVTVRGDAKSSPTATTTQLLLEQTAADQIVKDSKNNALTTAQKTISAADAGQTITVVTEGSYSIVFDSAEAGVNANQNVLAGGTRLVGRLKVTATKEAALIKDLVIENFSGTATATNQTLTQLKLYTDKNLANLIPNGTADVSSGDSPKALFQGLNGGSGIEIPTTGATYIYVGAVLNGIDYSSSPSSNATAEAGKTIILRVPDNSTGYATKVYGKVTGNLYDNTTPIVHTVSKTSTVMGAVITAMTTAFANATLADGSRDIFSFKVTVPASSNVDYDGAALGVKLASTTFTVASTSPITLSSYKIRRVGGAAEQTVSGADEITNNASSFVMNLENIFTNGSDQSDLIVKPGETAEFIIRATVAGTAASKSLQVSIDNVDNDVFYTHNVGSLGAFTADATAVHPLVSGLSSVSGGTLSN